MTKTATKLISFTVALMLVVSCFALAGCGKSASSSNAASSNNATVAPVTVAPTTPATFDSPSAYTGKKTSIEIKVKDYGTIEADLFDDLAPITVANFKKLVNDKFYDDLTFHRIIKDFMIQGGDPKGDGTGGSSDKIKGEFANNGVQNNLAHTRGVLSMARSNDPNGASSQFFIVHKDSPHLNGDYAAFGVVTKGMDVVDKITESVPVTDGNGTVAKSNQPVIESIRLK